MAFNAGAAVGFIQLDAKQFLNEVKKVSGANKGMAGGFLKAQAAFAVLQQGVRQLTGFFKDSVKAHNEQIKVNTQLKAVLEATAGAAGLTYDQLKENAKALSELTGIADEAINRTQALMLTFTQISKDVFPEAIEAAADMSEMFGQDLQQSAIQLGTALNDPIAGVGRLKRIGISFTEDQRESIKTFVAQNDVMSAQKVILDELKAEFGGVARAAGETFEGSMRKLNNAFVDSQELVGGFIASGMQPFVQNMTEMMRGVEDFLGTAEGMAVVETLVLGISNVFFTLQKAAETAFNSISDLADSFSEIFELDEATKGMAVFSTVLSQVSGALAVVFEISKRLTETTFEHMKTIIDSVSESFTELFGDVEESNIVFTVLGGIVQGISAGFAILGKFIKLNIQLFVDMVKTIQKSADVLGAVGDALADPSKWGKVGEAFLNLGASFGEMTSNVIDNTVDLVKTTIDEVSGFMEGAAATAQDIEKVYTDVTAGAVAGMEDLNAQQKKNLADLKENVKATAAAVAEAQEEAAGTARKFEDTWGETFETLKTNLAETTTAFGFMSKQAQQDFKALFDHIKTGVEDATSAFMMGFDAVSAAMNEHLKNREIENDNWYEGQKEAIEQNIVDEEEKTAALEKLDADYQRKQKALRREQAQNEKIAGIFSSLINTAVGVTQALSAAPPPFNFILAGIVAAAGAVQTALIAARPIPQFEKGGVGKGPMIVGEAGPELVNLGTTSRIIPNEETRALLNGPGGVNITFTGNIARETDLDRMLKMAGAQARAIQKGAI